MSRPLEGRRVLVARARPQASRLSDRIRALGGEPVEAPVLDFVPGDEAALLAAVAELAAGGFAAACFTSPNGVAALADAAAAAGQHTDILGRVPTIACVGPGTAEALEERFGVRPDLLPDRATTEALGDAFPAGSGRVLLPRADQANPVLSDRLRDRGYEPVEVTAYRTVAPPELPPEVLGDLTAGRIDLLAFASSSTVRNFVALVGDRPWAGAAVSIGPVTSATCRGLGIPVAAEADPHDLEGLVAALVRAARRAGAGRDFRRTLAWILAVAALAAAWRFLRSDGSA